MSNFAITTRREVLPVAKQPLFQQAIGDAAYAALPSSLRAFHERDAAPVWSGVADVDGSISLIARLARTVFGLPKAGRDIAISVTVARDGDGEKWTRSFGGSRFVSRMKLSGPSHVTEAIGPFAFDLALGCDGGSVAMPVAGWRLFGVPLPLTLAPRSDSKEFEDADGCYRFDVRLSMPLVGLLAHYRGWLRPCAVDASPECGGRQLVSSPPRHPHLHPVRPHHARAAPARRTPQSSFHGRHLDGASLTIGLRSTDAWRRPCSLTTAEDLQS